jgi:hypothetical protein
MGWVAAAVVLSTAVTYAGQQQQAKQARKQAREAAAERERGRQLEQKRANIQASRQRRRAAAEARRFRASAVNRAALSGAGGAIGASGSTVPAVTANLQSQLNYNNAFINRITDLNQGIRSAFGNAQDIASRPNTAGMGLMALGSAIGAFASYAGKIGKTADIPASKGSGYGGSAGRGDTYGSPSGTY